ncbi:MAG: EAL domain-containing protein [Acidovorax sp.]|nr:EAL domain-containing protein [Acidovorax sp.]
MRLTAAQAILQSRVGRQLLATFFVLVAVPVGIVSLLAYQLTEYVVQQSASQLSSELAKAVGINLIDRLRAAESLLLIDAHTPITKERERKVVEERLSLIFSSVDSLSFSEYSNSSNAPSGLSSLRISSAAAPGMAPTVDLIVPLTTSVVRGRFNANYLWENAQSGTHRFCFSSAHLHTPYCLGVSVTEPKAIRTQREIFFQPYFDAPSWTLATTVEPDVRRYLPIGVAALVGSVAVIAFLLAAVSSSVVLRRVTRPLDALTSGTRAVLRGDFTPQVKIAGHRNEFTDLADSFNAMAEEVGRDLQIFRLLAQMDQAIIEQRPFGELVQLMLTHLGAQQTPPQVSVVQWPVGASQPVLLFLAPDGALEQTETTAPGDCLLPTEITNDDSIRPGDTPWHHVLIAQTKTQSVWLRLARSPEMPERTARELAAFRQRLAVALHAEQHEQQLRERATQDSLTGLLNRFGLVEAIDELTHPRDEFAADRQPSPLPFAVVYMDLDGFKEVNDAYGHDVGDCVLREVAARLRNCLGSRALAMARPGGDEFVFVLTADALGVFRDDIETVRKAVQAPYSVPPRILPLAASMGVALFPEHGASRDDLLKHADLAMFSAKSAGRNVLVEFQHALAAQLVEQQALRQDLRESLTKQQMFVVFQPRVGAGDRQIASVEALLRWRHPDKGLVSPDVFIPLAEESGFILDLGLWVLREALEQFARWRTDPQVPIRHISVNLSPIQLADPAFAGALQELLQEFQIQTGELELEITEGALIQDVDVAVERLAALRAHGVSIALDDFGVGYSAMRYLNRLPFDTLKIDKSFVSAFGVERPALAIATAIVALAKALDKRVVAEGVETLVQADLLQSLGVNELQGYLYGKPQTAVELEHLWGNLRS